MTAIPQLAEAGSRLALFSRLFGIALIAHVVGNSGQPDLPNLVGVVNLGVGLGGVLILIRPGRLLLVACGGLTMMSVVMEMPFTGNHWLVAALGGLAIVVGRADFPRFAPALRLLFLVFYGFAAFAKLNSAFFDPSVSCAVFYSDQLLNSWSLPTLAGSSKISTVVVWLTAIIELSVVPLLLFRRSRYVGVLLALGFHTIISYDLDQHFYDFTAVLIAYLVLFLPEGISDRIGTMLRPRSRPIAVTLAALLATLVMLATLPPTAGSVTILATIPFLLWIPASAALFVVVLVGRRPAERLQFQANSAVWLVVVMAVVNGLTPYTEVKTAFGFNMYSNLLTANGQSNHFVVRSTWPLRNGYTGPVEIVSTNDAGLDLYREHGYSIAFPEFQRYLFDRSVAVTYRRGTKIITVEDTSKVPELASGGEWWSRFLPLRSLDQQRPPRCQDVFFPAL